MKKTHFILQLIFLVFLTFSCSKDETSNDLPIEENTKLELTILDEQSNPVSNLEVSIFSNESDYLNNNNVVSTLNTNNSGLVTFENLESEVYYWKINNECYVNNDDSNSQNPLQFNEFNAFDISLTNNFKGNIIITNNTTDEYVYILSASGLSGPSTVSPGVINSNTTINYLNAPTGFYFFQFGNVNNSSDTRGFNVILSCNQTHNILIE